MEVQMDKKKETGVIYRLIGVRAHIGNYSGHISGFQI